jgi:2-desacetyl-2-hydroxyethyl bacteriochlorophyllide A dehydrogenase
MKLPTKMMAAVLYGVNDVRVVEREVPAPGPEEALIKVEACGVCGGDIKIITKGMPNQPPFGEFIIGHEYAGTVVALGDTVDEFKVGDRIAVEIHKGCMRCKNCLVGDYTACLNYGNLQKGHRANGFTADGGFAEYAVNHVNTLAKLPDNISFDESTIITTAGSSIYGIDQAGGYIAGDTVAVLGPGPIGLMCVQACKALGAGMVILTGTRQERLELGKKLGADHIVNAKQENPADKVLKLTDGLGADLVLEAAGSDNSLQQAIEMTRKGGKISILAFYKRPITADISAAVRNRINLYTIRGEGRLNVHRALSLMAQGKMVAKDLITHTFPLEQINEAFLTYVERRGGALKVVVHP